LAHSISAKKRIRQNSKERLRNRSKKSALRTNIKKFHAAVASGDNEAAQAAFAVVQKQADTIARKGVVHQKTAARIKSRLSHSLNSLQTA
jgi:small subunit ribosomal protein S20